MHHNAMPYLDWRTILIVCLLLPLLASCSGPSNVGELEAWMDEVRARPGGPLPSIPEIKPYEQYVYQGSEETARDPFRSYRAVQKEKLTPQDVGLTDAVRREMERNREELENYELDGLRMVGMMDREGEKWAIIQAADDVLHRVTTGNYMGKNLGKIINVFDDRVAIREIYRNENTGHWEEREASLTLAEQGQETR